MTKEELKKWRKKMGLTQHELAQLLGYRKYAVMKWEQGKNPVPEWLELIALLIKREHINAKTRKAR